MTTTTETKYAIRATMGGKIRYASDPNAHVGASHFTCWIDRAKTWKTRAGAAKWLDDRLFVRVENVEIFTVEIDRVSKRPKRSQQHTY